MYQVKGSIKEAIQELRRNEVESLELAPVCTWQLRSGATPNIQGSSNPEPQSLASNDVLQALRTARECKTLKTLVLRHITLDEELCIWLANVSKYHPSLTLLDVSNARLDEEGARMLLDGTKLNPNLKVKLSGVFDTLQPGLYIPQSMWMARLIQIFARAAECKQQKKLQELQENIREIEKILRVLQKYETGSKLPTLSLMFEHNLLPLAAQSTSEVLDLILKAVSVEDFYELEADGIPLYCLADRNLGVEGAKLISQKLEWKQEQFDEARRYSSLPRASFESLNREVRDQSVILEESCRWHRLQERRIEAPLPTATPGSPSNTSGFFGGGSSSAAPSQVPANPGCPSSSSTARSKEDASPTVQFK